MLRLRSNCSVMLTCPKVLCDVISVTDEIRPNSRSRGVATEEAMISGLAPGREADTETVGKSTCGSGDTGNNLNAATPDKPIAAVSSVVAMGREMKGAEKFMARTAATAAAARRPAIRSAVLGGGAGRQALRPNCR